MANSPRKSKDPTDLALSAIEDALNVSRDAAPTPAAPTPTTTERATSPSERLAATRRSAAETRRTNTATAPRVEPAEPLGRGTFAEEPADKLAAANENRESVGQLL